MAVDATYMNNLLPSQLLVNREIIRPNIQQQQQQNQLLNLNNNSAMYSNAPQMNSALVPSNNQQQQSVMQFFYQSNNNVCDPNNKTDSGLTFHQNNNNMVSLQRKRSRDLFISELFTEQQHKKQQQQPPPFINQDVLFQFQNQTQSEIDRVLAHHTEKVRMEMEEQKIRQSRLVLSLLQETMAKKLKEKDEEIQRMEKLNMALQERVKSLCVENQVWKELAHTNETTANYLRTNLEQILAHVGTGAAADDHRHGGADDDAESCCGSNDDVINKNEKKCGSAEEETAATAVVGGGGGGGEGVSRMCKSCGVRESIVLLLPCRHLCLCTMCGSSVRNCPVCDSGMDASVHVNLS